MMEGGQEGSCSSFFPLYLQLLIKYPSDQKIALDFLISYYLNVQYYSISLYIATMNQIGGIEQCLAEELMALASLKETALETIIVAYLYKVVSNQIEST